MTEETKSTLKATRPWVAMFVDIPAALNPQCETLVTPLSVVRVKHVTEATERLLEVRPLLVLVHGDENAPAFVSLRERCVDAQAVFTVLPLGCNAREAETALKVGFRMAEAFL